MIHEIKQLLNKNKFLLIGISGIDGSGKGFHSKKIKEALLQEGITSDIISVDGWLSHPNKRISNTNKGYNFYHNGIDFNRFKEGVHSPLKLITRSI